MDVVMVDVNRAVVRRPQPPQGVEEEKRLPDFTVRARVGTGAKDWMRVGSAWKGVDNEGYEVITVALSVLPIAVNNRVTLKLLIPFAETKPEAQEVELPAGEVETFSRRRRTKEPDPTI